MCTNPPNACCDLKNKVLCLASSASISEAGAGSLASLQVGYDLRTSTVLWQFGNENVTLTEGTFWRRKDEPSGLG